MVNQLKDIVVPSSYKHLITREYKHTEDYKPDIRNLINKRAGQVITNKDFNLELGTSTATGHVRKLMNQGYITRKPKKLKTGRGYTYQWHDTPLDTRSATLKNGGVVTNNLDLPSFNITNDGMLEIDCAFLEWSENQTNGDMVLGAIAFRKHLRVTKEEIQQKRDKILEVNNGVTSNNRVPNTGVHAER